MERDSNNNSDSDFFGGDNNVVANQGGPKEDGITGEDVATVVVGGSGSPGPKKRRPSYVKAIIYGVLGLVLGSIAGYYMIAYLTNLSVYVSALVGGLIVGVLFIYLGLRAGKEKDASKAEKVISLILLASLVLGLFSVWGYYFFGYYSVKETLEKMADEAAERNILVADASQVGEEISYEGTDITLIKYEKEKSYEMNNMIIAYFDLKTENEIEIFNSHTGRKNTFYSLRALAGYVSSQGATIESVNGEKISPFGSFVLKENSENEIVISFIQPPYHGPGFDNCYIAYNPQLDDSYDIFREKIRNAPAKQSEVVYNLGTPSWKIEL